MIVICKVQWCPYFDKRGYCAKPGIVSIDGLGMCDVLWKNGQHKMLRTDYEYLREEMKIEEAERVVSDTQEAQNNEQKEPDHKISETGTPH